MKQSREERQRQTYRLMCGAMGGREAVQWRDLEMRHAGRGRIDLYQAGRRVMSAIPGEGLYFEGTEGWGDAFCRWLEECEPSDVLPGTLGPAPLMPCENEQGLTYYTCEDFPDLALAPDAFEVAPGEWQQRDRWGVALLADFQQVYQPQLTLHGAEKLARAIGQVEDWNDLHNKLQEALRVLRPGHLADWRDAEIRRRQNAPARSPITGRFRPMGATR